MVQLHIKSLNKQSITCYKFFLQKTLKKMNLQYKIFNLPTIRKRITLLKSPHVNKSAREQFQLKSYKCTLFIKDETNKNRLRFLILNKPKTIKVTLKFLGG